MQGHKHPNTFDTEFQADPMLLKNVIGLSPDKSKHQFYLDIQPVSIFHRIWKFIQDVRL